jgi:hypothetical protein
LVRTNQPCCADEFLIGVVEHEDAGAAPKADAQQCRNYPSQRPPPRLVAFGERPAEAFDYREHRP